MPVGDGASGCELTMSVWPEIISNHFNEKCSYSCCCFYPGFHLFENPSIKPACSSKVENQAAANRYFRNCSLCWSHLLSISSTAIGWPDITLKFFYGDRVVLWVWYSNPYIPCRSVETGGVCHYSFAISTTTHCCNGCVFAVFQPDGMHNSMSLCLKCVPSH